MSEAAEITRIVPWYGSKATLAPAIVEELGPHRVYLEPMCGSMAVLLAKPVVAYETVNDLHGDLINLARVIQDSALGPSLYRRLRRTLFAEDLQIEAGTELAGRQGPGPDRAPDPARAYWYFMVSWMGRNGTAGMVAHSCSKFCVRYTPRGGDPGRRFAAAVDSIPAWRRRLRGVTILCRDAFEILAKMPDEPGVAIYVDPPYLIKDKPYIHDFQDGGLLAADGGDDHARLAQGLARFRRSRVVVSYYQHPRLQALYPPDRWRRRCLARANFLANARRGAGRTEAPEVLLINGPRYSDVRGATGDTFLWDDHDARQPVAHPAPQGVSP